MTKQELQKQLLKILIYDWNDDKLTNKEVMSKIMSLISEYEEGIWAECRGIVQKEMSTLKDQLTKQIKEEK